MIEFGKYLLQMTCWMTAFWFTYHFILRHETFFQVNRWFLNFGLITSMILPLFPIQYSVIVEPMNLVHISPNITSTVSETDQAKPINYWAITYGAGLLLSVFYTFWRYYNVYRWQRSSTVETIQHLKVHKIDNQLAPFSFFDRIYVSSNIASNDELNTIVAHEKVHIQERHWADLLVLEVVRTIQWFNPLTQLYRKAMMQNHEYLADYGTLQQGVSQRHYQAILANQMLGLSVVRFANSFTFINSQNRIKMMKQNKSNPKNILKVLAILPLVSLILMSFSEPKYEQTETTRTPVASEELISIKGKVMSSNGETLIGAIVLVDNTKNGVVTDKHGEFTLKNVSPEDKLVVQYINHKAQTIKAAKELNITLESNDNGELLVQKKNAEPINPKNPPLYIVDGKELADITFIPTESIQSINVLKSGTEIQKYGKKGENGVIIVTTKQGTTPVKSSNGDKSYVVVEEMPQYPGGDVALNNEIKAAAKKYDTSGSVYVTFRIETDGEISNIEILKSSDIALNGPAMLIVKDLKKFKPGKQNGKTVVVNYTVKVEF